MVSKLIGGATAITIEIPFLVGVVDVALLAVTNKSSIGLANLARKSRRKAVRAQYLFLAYFTASWRPISCIHAPGYFFQTESGCGTLSSLFK